MESTIWNDGGSLVNIAKYKVLKNGIVKNLTVSNFNTGRLDLMDIIGTVPTVQMRKVTNLLVGQAVIIKGYTIICRGKNPSFNEMRDSV